METYPVGVRFLPTEEEIVMNYLKSKIVGCTDHGIFILVLDDFYAWDPWDLPQVYQERSNVPSDGTQWFFFCPSPYQRRNSDRNISRKTKSGAWKITCQRDNVKARDSKDLIGTKRTLTFYKGRKLDRTKTGWIMHEYHLNPDLLGKNYSSLQMPFILCRLKRQPSEKLDATTSYGQETSSVPVVPQHSLLESINLESSLEAYVELLPQLHQQVDNNPSNYSNSYSNYNRQTNGDDQSSYEAIMESFPEIQPLYNYLPSYPNSYSDYTLQPLVYDENEVNHLSGPWSMPNYYEQVGAECEVPFWVHED